MRIVAFSFPRGIEYFLFRRTGGTAPRRAARCGLHRFKPLAALERARRGRREHVSHQEQFLPRREAHSMASRGAAEIAEPAIAVRPGLLVSAKSSTPDLRVL
jgi:hypothetical protein